MACVLENNILDVAAGYDLYVTPDSQNGFRSDYNLFYRSSAINARVGYWNGADRAFLDDWRNATALELHSVAGDPLFVDPDGADNVLGYSTTLGGVDGGSDDNFQLSSGSPAIDRADTWSAPLTDILGFTRQDDPGTTNHGSPDYFPAASPQPAFPSGGTAQNWRGTGTYFNFTLPFSFTFYGQAYAAVSVSTNGYLQFAGPDFAGDGSNPSAKLLRDARIAPLWASLDTTHPGDDIYVDQSIANQVTFRWVATNTTDNSPANFAVTLFSNGNIQFYYGAGNTNLTPTVGISAGNGTAYQLLPGYSGQANLTNAASILWTLNPGIVDLGAYEFRGSSLDTTPPAVAGTSPALVNGGTYSSFAQLRVSFTKPVNSIDADSSAAYELRKAGSQGFGSTDDVVYSLTPLYSLNDNTVTLSINGLGSGNLPPGNYRFTIFSNNADSIHDLSGNALDGDGDGVAGGAFTRTFTLTIVPTTRTWDGGGTDNLWTTAANWVGDVAPLPGDNLVFPAIAAQFNNVNDYPPGTQFGSITVSGTGYIFHNGILSTTSVQVPSGTLTVDSIVADSLTIGVPSVAMRTWNGGGTDNHWTTAANWVGSVAPLPGDNLVFPAIAAQLENVNDYPPGTQFGSITVSGTGYIFHNGILSTTSVQVPSGTLTVDSIVADSLTIGTPSVATRTWNGGGTDNKWSTAANWVGNVAPLPGDNLVFPAAAAQQENVNDYPAGTVFGSITVLGTNYHFQNGISSSSNVQVPSGTLTATSIVCDTLTIGSSSGAAANTFPRITQMSQCRLPQVCRNRLQTDLLATTAADNTAIASTEIDELDHCRATNHRQGKRDKGPYNSFGLCPARDRSPANSPLRFTGH